MSFELFDPTEAVRITAGNLPHWYQPRVTYFITFRTEDSFPVLVADQWFQRRAEWLQRRGISARQVDWKVRLRKLPLIEQREFHETFSRELMEHLDKGHGACVLRDPELSQIVADSLHHFEGVRYFLGDFVVVPNHVHLLVCMIGTTEVESQCYSWKKFTATKINKVLGQKDRFWQEESFDHLVRSPGQFDRLRDYIAENPKKAGLRSGEYLYWKRDEV